MTRSALGVGFLLSALVHAALLLAWMQGSGGAQAPTREAPLTVQLSQWAEPSALAPQAALSPAAVTVAAPAPPRVEPSPEPLAAVPVAPPSTEPPPVMPSEVTHTASAAAEPIPDTTSTEPAPEPQAEAIAELEQRYLARLLRLIEQHQSYPRSARRLREQGTATVRFRIHRDGRLDQWTLQDSSGSAVLDQAALAAVERLAQAEPIPAALAREQWTIALPIVYRLHDASR